MRAACVRARRLIPHARTRGCVCAILRCDRVPSALTRQVTESFLTLLSALARCLFIFLRPVTLKESRKKSSSEAAWHLENKSARYLQLRLGPDTPRSVVLTPPFLILFARQPVLSYHAPLFPFLTRRCAVWRVYNVWFGLRQVCADLGVSIVIIVIEYPLFI